MTTDDIVRLSSEVATVVRQRIPRSANRYLETGNDESEWLKEPISIQYTELLQTLVRTGTKGPGNTDLKQLKKEKTLCVFTKTVSTDVTIRKLKEVLYDFLQNGKIDGKPIDLSYKAGKDKDVEKAYSTKFAIALAAYLNAKGVRVGKDKFQPDSVMRKVRRQLTNNDRLVQAFGMKEDDVLPAIHGKEANRALQFPARYLASAARNAIKWGIGNCEECGCAAFCMLVTFKRANGAAVGPLGEGEGPKVELVQAKAEGDAHFFVVLNRPGTVDIYDDFSTWFNNTNVVACDPWITDAGVGARITTCDALRSYLKPSGKDGPSFLAVRATGHVGSIPADFKENDKFRLS